MAQAMDADEPSHLVDTGTLGAQNVVELAQSFAQLVPHAGRTQRRRGAGCRGSKCCNGSQFPPVKPRCATIGRHQADPVNESDLPDKVKVFLSTLRLTSAPMRVAILGNSGSGKSTLSAALAAAGAVPCLDLDAVAWELGKTAVPRDDELARADVRVFCRSNPHWVVEG